MTNNDLLKLAVYIVGQYSPGRELKIGEWNVLLQAANIKHFNRKVGLPEEYQPGMPAPRQVPDLTLRMQTDLRPFSVYLTKENGQPLEVDENGYAVIPDDYYVYSSLGFRYIKDGVVRYRPIDICDDSEYIYRQGSKLTYPTKRNPIANFKNNYIRFLPKQLQFVEMTYLRRPATPVHAVNWENGYAAYSSAGSTELEWDDLNKLNVLSIVLEDIGFNIKGQDVIAYAERKKREGA